MMETCPDKRERPPFSDRPEKKILFTFPGKLGDLIYSLPAVRAGALHFKTRVYYQTSEFCRPALPLLNQQPYIAEAFIDPHYKPDHARFGLQPYIMTEPPGYSEIFHLGFRPEILGASILVHPLIDTFFNTLDKVYQLRLEACNHPYLHVGDGTLTNAVIFQGHGETLRDLMDYESKRRLAGYWAELFRLIGRRVTAVCAPGEREIYNSLGIPAVCPSNLLLTARMIRTSALFIGVQSAAAALADGLAAPRLIFAWFKNALPFTPNGATFGLDDDPARTASILKERLGV